MIEHGLYIKNYVYSIKYETRDLFRYNTKENYDVGQSFGATVIRKNLRYTEDENNIYIYYNAGFYYKGSTFYGRLSCITAGSEELEEHKKVVMTDENSDDFSVVKVTYRKDGDNIYFKEIDLLKDY